MEIFLGGSASKRNLKNQDAFWPHPGTPVPRASGSNPLGAASGQRRPFLGRMAYAAFSHAALKSAIASSRLAAYPRSCTEFGSPSVV